MPSREARRAPRRSRDEREAGHLGTKRALEPVAVSRGHVRGHSDRAGASRASHSSDAPRSPTTSWAIVTLGSASTGSPSIASSGTLPIQACTPPRRRRSRVTTRSASSELALNLSPGSFDAAERERMILRNHSLGHRRGRERKAMTLDHSLQEIGIPETHRRGAKDRHRPARGADAGGPLQGRLRRCAQRTPRGQTRRPLGGRRQRDVLRQIQVNGSRGSLSAVSIASARAAAAPSRSASVAFVMGRKSV